jgi:hypothetical protein
VNLAARGLREVEGGGHERITDPGERATVRAQAWRVHLQSAALGVLLTALAFLLPSF